MIKPVRKIHFAAWQMVIIIIPLAFVFALLFRPDKRIQNKQTDNFFRFEVARRDSVFHIMIEVLNPITTPSCAVFAQTANSKILLGTLSTQQRYSFTTSTDVKSILLFDGIHKKEIKTYLIPEGL